MLKSHPVNVPVGAGPEPPGFMSWKLAGMDVTSNEPLVTSEPACTEVIVKKMPMVRPATRDIGSFGNEIIFFVFKIGAPVSSGRMTQTRRVYIASTSPVKY